MLRKSRILVTLLALMSATSLSSCGTKKLLILNWGEYISEDVVKAFEQEYNCEVSISIADSNELFYSKVKSGTTVYDLVVPSDYMVKKMYESDLLQKIDKTKLPHFSQDAFLPGVQGIEEIYMSDEYGFKEYADYQVPYFWGTFGLMYSKKKAGLEEALNNYDWQVIFEEDKRPEGTTVGMYNVPRDAYAAAMFYKELSPNLIGDEYLNVAKEALMQGHFDQWSTDELKKEIQKGDLDCAFVYTGDFLDMYYQETGETVDYDIYIPDRTIAFMDSFVITKNSRNVDLAHQFIDYFLITENAVENASVVGYCTPLISSYEEIVSKKTSADLQERRWGEAMEKYYPLPKEGEKKFKGTPLTNFSKDYITKVNNMVNDVKTSS